jgi:hypothetical protein
VGHEPSVLFYSNLAGSGNSNTWRLRLPHESPTLATQDGTGGTWSFQQHITFWFGMTLCESASYSTPGHPCSPDTNANIKESPEPTAPDGSATTPAPGSWGSSSTRRAGRRSSSVRRARRRSGAPRWRSPALSDSLTQTNNDVCLDSVGEEWASFAFLTKTGVPQAPPDPPDRHGGDVHAGSVEGAVHERGRPDLGLDPRLFGGARHGDQRPDDRRARLDDREHRERVRTSPVPARRLDGFRGAVRVPPDVLDVERAHALCRRARTRTTSRSRTRSATSSTATGRTRSAGA